MAVILLLIPIALIIAGGFLWAFYRANESGQFDDIQSPAVKILKD